MKRERYSPYKSSLTRFNRRSFTGKDKFTYIGSGELGGKAHGLAMIKGVIESKLKEKYLPEISIDIPSLTVITTEYFDLFMKQNDLFEIAYSEERDDLIAHAFQKADLPVQLVGDLRALVYQVHTPLAVRSSSMLEDAMFEPFASVYATKMIPNCQYDVDSRFRILVEAVKFIYASTFFNAARNYMKATHHTTMDEKMAVIIQEVIGSRFGDRFYPHISGVIRSYNFYPTGNAVSEDGIVDLALGLGRIIVDDNSSWSFSPAYPRTDPPFKSIGDMLKYSQTKFWGINMGKPSGYDPIKDTEYMKKYDLGDGEYDGTLRHLASTYDPQNEKIDIGIGTSGPRVINFAPILKAEILPLNNLLQDLVKTCEDTLGNLLEIEFAMRLGRKKCTPANFGFLQVRPMVVSRAEVEISPDELTEDNVLLASDRVLGNGTIDTIKNVVYIMPDRFEIKNTYKIASELEILNRSLVDAKQPYMLIGFGRWGTTDPFAGIPINFGQISGAKIIVESSLPGHNFIMSQGSHFFHNVTSFEIFYFSVLQGGAYKIDWNWLDKQQKVEETEYIRHVMLLSPLNVKVDGRTGQGVIHYG